MANDVRAIDLHCDLLIYLANDPRRRPWDPLARASLPHLIAGGVGTQVLAVYSWLHDRSVELGHRQLEIFESLEQRSGGVARKVSVDHSTPSRSAPEQVYVAAALESAATFATESEPLTQSLERLETILERFGPIVYISLTWNEENRFGGGNDSKVGLKPDGRELLAFLSGRRVAIDFSHTSDALADGILEEIDASNLHIPVLASHSNYRSLCEVPRNLPDRIAKEIINRRGVIGLNVIARFVGETPHELLDHVERGLALGGAESIALGADYFASVDIPARGDRPPFFDRLSNASTYPWLIERMLDRFGAIQTNKIQSGNAASFLERLWRA